jgi:hypothetical protein
MIKRYRLSDVKSCGVCGRQVEVLSEEDELWHECDNCGRFCCENCKPKYADLCCECPEQTEAGVMTVAARRGYLFGNLTGNHETDPVYPRVARRWYQTKSTAKGLRRSRRYGR